MKTIIEYFRNWTRVKELEKEVKRLEKVRNSLEDIKRTYKKGDRVFYSNAEGDCKRVKIIWFAWWFEEWYIICVNEQNNEMVLKKEKQLFNLKD